MTMFDRIGDMLRATGATILEALGLRGKASEIRSRGFSLTSPDEVPGIISRVAGSPGRRVAGSPGRRVAQSASCVMGPLSSASLPA